MRVNPIEEVGDANEGIGGGRAAITGAPRVETDDVPVARAADVNVRWTTTVALHMPIIGQ